MIEKTIFTWTEELSVGDAVIDSQHRGIFEATNRLFDIVAGDRAPEEIVDVLITVERYVREHFSYEEAYMERHGYPGLLEHARIHSEFIVDFTKRKQDFAHERISSEHVLAFENYLGEWLIRHVGNEDQKYVAFIRAHPETIAK